MRRKANMYLAEETTSAELAEWFREIARRMDAEPRRTLLVVHGAPGVDAWLDADPADGELVARIAGRGDEKFSLRHRWIADHPLPLRLSRAASCGRPFVRALRIDPVDANRFRVCAGFTDSERARAARAAGLVALAAGLAGVGLARLHWIAVALVALLAAAALLSHPKEPRE